MNKEIELKDIINFKNYNNLEFIDCACSVTKKQSGKRSEKHSLITCPPGLLPPLGSKPFAIAPPFPF